MKAAILVDEINAVSQIHLLGIEGIRSWKKFYESIETVLKKDYNDLEVSYHFYGAIVPMNLDKERHFLRRRFFEALQKDGIRTHKGYCFNSEKGIQEKGVDMMVGLDLYQFSLNQHDLLFIFSGDTDMVPAVKRAQENGSKVFAILSEKQPASLMKRTADGVIPLEALIDLIEDKYIIPRTINTPLKGEILV